MAVHKLTLCGAPHLDASKPPCEWVRVLCADSTGASEAIAKRKADPTANMQRGEQRNCGICDRGSGHLKSQKKHSAARRNTGAAQRIGADADSVGAANAPVSTVFNLACQGRFIPTNALELRTQPIEISLKQHDAQTTLHICLTGNNTALPVEINNVGFK